MILWTYQQIGELGRRRLEAISRSRPDIRIIHTPVEIASLNRIGQDVDLERGINSQIQRIPTDDVPPYESLENTPKDL
jgi:hypothetical protein